MSKGGGEGRLTELKASALSHVSSSELSAFSVPLRVTSKDFLCLFTSQLNHLRHSRHLHLFPPWWRNASSPRVSVANPQQREGPPEPLRNLSPPGEKLQLRRSFRLLFLNLNLFSKQSTSLFRQNSKMANPCQPCPSRSHRPSRIGNTSRSRKGVYFRRTTK
jgi:hypothetical protein